MSGPENATRPTYEHGKLMRFVRSSSNGWANNISITDAVTQKTTSLRFWPAKVQNMTIVAVSYGEDQKLSVSAHTMTPTGPQSYLYTVDQDGTAIQTTPTEDYLATRIVRMADGSTWTLGIAHALQESTSKQYKNYDAFRHYAANGQLLEHLWPRWGDDIDIVTSSTREDGSRVLIAHSKTGMPDKTFGPPFFGPTSGFARPMSLFMVNNGDNVVIYDGVNSKIHLWQSKLKKLTSWKISERLSGMSVNGLALLSNGTILASRTGVSANSNASAGDAHAGLFSLKVLSNSFATWSPVKVEGRGMATTGDFRVLGSDNGKFVYVDAALFPHQAAWGSIESTQP
ncbi:PapG chaperone-binding domain-containing protein [Terriglobus roseus]|nr:PapG chaperone-binding domain-containing protein [Terriglobus roseus]